MNRIVRVGYGLCVAVWLGCGLVAAGQEKAAGDVSLPAPERQGGKPLMQALSERKSTRAFNGKPLPAQMLSNLLWAAFGVNRPESGKRTAPSAVNWQEIDVYAALPDGLYLYDAKAHKLKLVLAEDIRAQTGVQKYIGEASVNLVYVPDRSRISRGTDADKDFYSATDTGFVSQNVYLFCASEGLATVVVGMVDRPALAKKMDLKPEQRIMLTQPVGYPKEEAKP